MNAVGKLPVCWMVCLGLLLGPPPAAPAAVNARNDLSAQAEQIARTELERLGQPYVAEIDRSRHIIYLSALDADHRRRTQQLLSAFTDAQRRTLLDKRLPWNLTVVLPTVDDYREMAAHEQLEHATGFFQPARRRLVSIDHGRVLIHEFTHALHQADMDAARQVHPIWIREGLATLFETSRITPLGLVPMVDGRLLAIRDALEKKAQKKLIPLEGLFAMSPKDFMASPRLCYAESRYAMFYLYSKDRLRTFYEAYKQGYSRDPTGERAYEKALGRRLFLIEPEWEQWLKSLRLPTGSARRGQGRLGIEVAQHSRGVEVVRLLKDGAARRAGRIREGDVIVTFNGTDVTGPAQFFAVVRSTGAKKTVLVKLLRHNRPLTVHQPLGAAPPP